MEKGRLAGIDYGTVRIGVAICDPERTMALPYLVYVRRTEKLDDDFFRRFAQDERIVKFVVGLPIHLDGRLSARALEAKTFGERLAALTGLAVDYMDERFTSVEAIESIQPAHWTTKKRKKKIDAVAAQILLEHYLQRGCVGTDAPESIDD